MAQTEMTWSKLKSNDPNPKCMPKPNIFGPNSSHTTLTQNTMPTSNLKYIMWLINEATWLNEFDRSIMTKIVEKNT